MGTIFIFDCHTLTCMVAIISDCSLTQKKGMENKFAICVLPLVCSLQVSYF